MDEFVKECIDAEVRQLHEQIWRQRVRLFPGGDHSVIRLLDPYVACAVLGIQYEVLPFIDARFARPKEGNVLAGLIDRQSNKIAVCDSQPLEMMRFTAGHEIGHWCLHKDEVLHRDRPVGDLELSSHHRPKIEQEADYFSACFLMPRKMVVCAFQQRFRVTAPIRLTDTLAYWLSPQDSEALLYAEKGSLIRERALAKCTGLPGRNFPSLAEQFKVSVSAMALRIRELGLVSWP